MQLEPGDSLLIYSDGLERIVAPQQTGGCLPESLQRAAEHVAQGDEPTLGTIAGTTEDALSGLFAGGPDAAVVAPSRTDDLVTESVWGKTLREEGPAAALEQISGRQTALRRMGYPLDDLTLLSICVAPQPSVSRSTPVLELAGQV